jgi:hypothetical protein
LQTPQPPERHSNGSGTPARKPASSSDSPGRTVTVRLPGWTVSAIVAVPARFGGSHGASGTAAVMPPTSAHTVIGDQL